MKPSDWEEILVDLESRDVDTCVAAVERLHLEAGVEDVPKLLLLLRNGRDFFIREATAWPLVGLVGPSVLRELFAAYQLGFDEGHDNDGFTSALLELQALYPVETKRALEQLIRSEIGVLRENAQWLLEFFE